MMSEYSESLGNAVFEKRKDLHMTQAELAEIAEITEQTIRKIEHGDGNPQLDVLSSLITVLKIDPDRIFYPGKYTGKEAKKQLDLLLADSPDEEVAALLPFVQEMLKLIRHSQNATK